MCKNSVHRKPSLSEALCTNCGLCCDGTLFEDVELKNEREALGLELMGVQIDTDAAPALPLPCTALDGRKCSIYKNRPGTCRRFECKLLQQTKLGNISTAEAKTTIKQTLDQAAVIKNLCKKIEGKKNNGSLREVYQSTVENHLSKKDPHDCLYAKLTKEMNGLDIMVKKHFIDM